MTAKYMYMETSVLDKKEGTIYNENIKLCINNIDDYDSKIECLKLERGAPSPKILPKQPRVAHRVDDLDHYAFQAQRIVFELADCGPGVCLTLVVWDDTIVKFYEEE